MAGQDRQAGFIVKLMTDKGFGFIADGSGKEYFFHRSSLRTGWDSLVLNQAITFVPRTSPKGPRAEDVELA